MKTLEEQAAALVEFHDFIYSVAHFWARRNPSVDLEDLAQEARIELLDRLESYDSSHGAYFMTHAKPYLMCRLKKFCCDNRETVRVPWHWVKEGREIQSISLETPVGPELASTVADFIAAPPPDTQMSDDKDLLRLVREAVGALPPNLRSVLGEYYLEELNDREIGERRGLTTQRAHQIRTLALQRLRQNPNLANAA